MGFILESEGNVENVEWGSLRWLSNPTTESSKQLTTLLVTLSVGQGHNFHFHPNQEEVIYVLEGSVEQWFEKEKKILNQGDSIFIPKGVVHASFQRGDTPCKFFVVLGPCAPNEVGYEIEDVYEKEPWASLRV